MPYGDARREAQAQQLDLVLVNKNSAVPVYKVMDHGKFKYSQKKNVKKSHQAQTKEMTFKIRIDPHDEKIKIDRICKFLSKGSDVKISVVMRGREKSHSKLATEKMSHILEGLKDLVEVQYVRPSPSSVIAVVRPLGKTHGKEGTQKENKDLDISRVSGRQAS